MIRKEIREKTSRLVQAKEEYNESASKIENELTSLVDRLNDHQVHIQLDLAKRFISALTKKPSERSQCIQDLRELIELEEENSQEENLTEDDQIIIDEEEEEEEIPENNQNIIISGSDDSNQSDILKSGSDQGSMNADDLLSDDEDISDLGSVTLDKEAYIKQYEKVDDYQNIMFQSDSGSDV